MNQLYDGDKLDLLRRHIDDAQTQRTQVMSRERAKRCIFCGQQNPSSNEDALPLWIQRTALERDPTAEMFCEWDGARRWQVRITDKKSNAFRVNRVCRSCNNGWMSALEEQVRPSIEPAIFGAGAVTWTRTQQRIVATWIAKTVVVFEHASFNMKGRSEAFTSPFFDADDRRHIYDAKLPPTNTLIWVAAYIPEDDLFFRHGADIDFTLAPAPPTFGAGEAYCSTMLIGHFAFQLVSFWRKRLDDKRGSTGIELNIGRGWLDKTILIWPPDIATASARWPPSCALDKQWFDALARRIDNVS